MIFIYTQQKIVLYNKYWMTSRNITVQKTHLPKTTKNLVSITAITFYQSFLRLLTTPPQTETNDVLASASVIHRCGYVVPKTTSAASKMCLCPTKPTGKTKVSSAKSPGRSGYVSKNLRDFLPTKIRVDFFIPIMGNTCLIMCIVVSLRCTTKGIIHPKWFNWISEQPTVGI